jgi:hypothetical protein
VSLLGAQRRHTHLLLLLLLLLHLWQRLPQVVAGRSMLHGPHATALLLHKQPLLLVRQHVLLLLPLLLLAAAALPI